MSGSAIVRFMHCRQCVQEKRPSLIETGLTISGFQVWCKRHNREIIHLTSRELEYLLSSQPPCDCCPEGKHLS